jgi:hypothetical protein
MVKVIDQQAEIADQFPEWKPLTENQLTQIQEKLIPEIREAKSRLKYDSLCSIFPLRIPSPPQIRATVGPYATHERVKILFVSNKNEWYSWTVPVASKDYEAYRDSPNAIVYLIGYVNEHRKTSDDTHHTIHVRGWLCYRNPADAIPNGEIETEDDP